MTSQVGGWVESPVEKILARLEGVRESRPGVWTARCPSHDDRRPSLGVYENGEGNVGLTCFKECTALDVLRAIGLDWADLFAEKLRPTKSTTEVRRSSLPRLSATEALDQLEEEARTVEIIAHRVRMGDFPDELADDLARCRERISAIRQVRRWRG